jgi:hypothetical protein
MTPSGMMASGSPLRVLNSRMRPQNLPAVLPADHVGVQPNRGDLEARQQAVHGLEHVAAVVVRRTVDVAARPVAGFSEAHLAIGLVELREAVLHGKKVGDLGIVEDESHVAGPEVAIGEPRFPKD